MYLHVTGTVGLTQLLVDVLCHIGELFLATVDQLFFMSQLL
jgi:hypothetical protein